jgi:hypothetical protein
LHLDVSSAVLKRLLLLLSSVLRCCRKTSSLKDATRPDSEGRRMVARDTILAVPSDRFHRERGNPLPEAGADFVAALIAEIEEDERLSAALGVDLTPAAPDPSHAPRSYLRPEKWIERSEEVHSMLEDRWKRAR